jgi:uncharacterized OB-fold protein
MDKPIPIIDDDDTGGHFAAAQRGAIAIVLCAECTRPIHLPLPRCPACGSWTTEWTDVTPRARVYSWTVVEHPVHPAFEVPYTVVLAELDDYPEVRLVSYLPGRVELEAGEPLAASFDDVRDGVVVPRWSPVAAH